MIVRNWMQQQPTTVPSDMLLSEAERILSENNLRALAVVDDGNLRGLLTRATCLRAADWVTRAQDIHETDYFVNRLKVRDLMTRRPKTVNVDDTMEHCLLTGQEEGLSQFPVLEDGRVVGMVSASEVFYMAAQMLAVWENWSGVTLAHEDIEMATLPKVAEVAQAAGATLQSIYTLAKDERSETRVVVRFEASDPAQVAKAYEQAGFKVLEIYLDRKISRNIATN